MGKKGLPRVERRCSVIRWMEPKWDGCKKLLGGEKELKVNRGRGVKRG